MCAGPLLVGRCRDTDRRRAAARVLGIALVLCLWPVTDSAADLGQAREMARDGRMQEALAEVKQVLDQDPDDLEANLLRGVLLGQLGDTDAAIEVFDDIARAHPELPEPHNNLAVLYAAQGRYERARDALLDAVRLQPDYDLAHENLGDVYAKLAALSYARAQRVNPANEGAARKAATAESLVAGEHRHAAPPPVATGGVTAAPAAAGEEVMAPCLTVAAITPPSRGDAVVSWLRERGLTVTRNEHAAGAGVTGPYRVYLPPMGSRHAASQRIDELRAAGVEDLIIISEGAHRNGISLGVFSRSASAERRVRELQSLGIDAQIEERGAGRATRVRAAGMVSPASFARAFPDLTFSTEDCQ